MDLNELSALADRLEGIEARYTALETLIQENGHAMSEILELLSKQGPDTANAIADALRSLHIMLPEQKAAQVNVTVPEIRMPEFKFPPAAAASDWSTLRVSVPQQFGGPDRVFTITKSK